MTSTIHRPRLLKRAFYANAAFSTLSGATMLLASSAIASAIGLPIPALVSATGLGLLVFAGVLIALTRSAEVPAAMAWAIVAGDAAWVIASFGGIALWYAAIPFSGKLLISGAADVVFAFALLQAFAIVMPASRTRSAQGA